MSVAIGTSRSSRRSAQDGSREALLLESQNGFETTFWAQEEADRKPLPDFEATPERKPLPSTWDTSAS